MKDLTPHTVPIPVDQRAKAIHQIRTALIEKKMTQAQLADVADCHEKTVQNLLGGRSVRDQTLFDVCMVLGLDFEEIKDLWHGSVARSGADGGSGVRENKPGPNGGPPGSAGSGQGATANAAPIYMGAYTRAAVDHYIGSYLTLRLDFSTGRTIVAYRTEISWDDEWPSLLFQEYDRPDAPRGPSREGRRIRRQSLRGTG